MKKLLILLAILIFVCAGVYALTSKPDTPKPALSSSTLQKIEGELESWGEGRWHNWDALYDKENSMLILEIAADPQANQTALDGYCDVLKDVANEYASGYSFVGRIYVLGEVKKKCY